MINALIPNRSGQQNVTSSLAVALVATVALAVMAAYIALAPLAWVLFTFAAITGAFLVLVYPWLAWLAFAFVLPIASAFHVGPATVTDLLFASTIALWCAAFVSQRRPLLPGRLPLWGIALYLLAFYLSSLGASQLDEALTEMVKWIEFAGLLVVMPAALPSRFVPWLVVALLAAAAIQGLYGLYQFIYRIGPDWFLIQGRFMRASGVFAQPNPFGAYLGLSLPVGASLTLWAISSLWTKRTLSHALWAAFYTTASACIGLGLIASWSRGAWLGAAGGILVVLALFHRRTAIGLGFGLLALTITALLGTLNPAWIPSAISGRIGDIPAYLGLIDIRAVEVNDDNFAVIERLAHWVAALRMWELSPWLGVGPGNYAHIYPSVALPRWNDPLGHAHNIYLNTLGETGIIGFGAFLLFWSSLLGWLLQQRRRFPAQSWSRALTVGIVGVTAHLAIHSLFDNLFVQGMYLHIAFWLAAVASTTRPSGSIFTGSTLGTLPESDG